RVCAHEILRSARRTAAFASTDPRAACRGRLRARRAAEACAPARRGCARAARGAAGPARAAWAPSSHFRGNVDQRLGDVHAQLLADLRLDLGRELRVLLEEVAGIVLALADAVLLVLVPGTGLVDHAAVDAQLEDLALERHALAV